MWQGLQSTLRENLAPDSCQRSKPSRTSMGSKLGFRSCLQTQGLLTVSRIKCLNHLLKRDVPFRRYTDLVARVDMTKVTPSLWGANKSTSAGSTHPTAPQGIWGMPNPLPQLKQEAFKGLNQVAMWWHTLRCCLSGLCLRTSCSHPSLH